MMNIKKVTSAVFVAVIVLTSMRSSFAKEKGERAEIKLLSVFGDTVLSLVPDASEGNQKEESSVDKLASYYSLVRDWSLVDFSSDGETAKSVLNALSDKKAANEKMKSTLKASDTVLLSVGGSDALNLLLPCVSKMLGLDPSKATVEDVLDALVKIKDEDLDAFVKKTKSFAEDNKKTINEFCESFSRDYAELIDVMKKNGMNAHIYVFTVYDPVSEMPDYLSVKALDSNIVSPILAKLNGVIKKQADDKNVHLVDASSEFSLKRKPCTLVCEGSLALSEYGHAVITSAITYEIDEVYRTMKNGDSEPQFEKGRNIWIWFAAAAEILVIVVFVAVVCVKKINKPCEKQLAEEKPKK